MSAAAPTTTPMKSVAPLFEPMPEVLRSSTPGTWAFDTMSRRVREDILLKVVYGDNEQEEWFAEVKPALDLLLKELEHAAETKLTLIDDDGEDVADWNELLSTHAGETWLSAPWLLAEFYLYRRIAAATRWFKEDEPPDVFAKAKTAGLESAIGALDKLAERTTPLLSDPEATTLFFQIALWGNRMDLSLWPAGANVVDSFAQVLDESKQQLLADDTERALVVTSALLEKGGGVVDIVVDNAGFELCTDLLLASHLLESGVAKKVRLRVKHHPTFVSDVLTRDVDAHISRLLKEESGLGALWKSYREDGRLECHAEPYWTMPYPLWEMPAALREEIATTSDLTIVKGDANYRRALGDRAWPLEAEFDQVVSFWPSPILCLRTLKAELGCGMPTAKVQNAKLQDKEAWCTNGRWGVLHFAPAGPSSSSSSSSK